MSDKNRIEGFKKMLENQTVNKILQNQELDHEIDQLQQKRTQLLIDLDKVLN